MVPHTCAIGSQCGPYQVIGASKTGTITMTAMQPNKQYRCEVTQQDGDTMQITNISTSNVKLSLQDNQPVSNPFYITTTQDNPALSFKLQGTNWLEQYKIAFQCDPN